MAATVSPENPEEVQVGRASDVLEARIAASDAFLNLFIGLGAVALLVGTIGIANVMVIAVIERRNEIGLRRALGATKFHIASQFLTESLLLSILGGITGVGYCWLCGFPRMVYCHSCLCYCWGDIMFYFDWWYRRILSCHACGERFTHRSFTD